MSRLHDRKCDGGRLHVGRHGCAAGRADADASRGDADQVDARDLGVMISASHNLFGGQRHQAVRTARLQAVGRCREADRGIARRESRQETVAERQPRSGAPHRRVHDRYIEFAKRTLPRNLSLDGLRVVIDCSHGAALQGGAGGALGTWRGRHLHRRRAGWFQHQRECGSTAPEALSRKVREMRADNRYCAGWRRRSADHESTSVAIWSMAISCSLLSRTSWKEERALRRAGIVSTSDVNLGLERLPEGAGHRPHPHGSGRSLVLEQMLQHRLQCRRRTLRPYHHVGPCDDRRRFRAALQVLAVVTKLGRPVSEVCHLFDPLPQILKNVRYRSGKPLDDAE